MQKKQRKAVSKGIVSICNEDWEMASITVLKTNGEVSAGIQVSFVWKSNVVPSEDVQLPVPQQFNS